MNNDRIARIRVAYERGDNTELERLTKESFWEIDYPTVELTLGMAPPARQHWFWQNCVHNITERYPYPYPKHYSISFKRFALGALKKAWEAKNQCAACERPSTHQVTDRRGRWYLVCSRCGEDFGRPIPRHRHQLHPAPTRTPEPEKIVEVEAIEELDLSFILLDEVPIPNGRTLKLKERLSLTPEFSDKDQLLSLAYLPLQIDVFAETRAQLWADLLEQVAMLWVEYAEAPDDVLSPPAREFRHALLRTAEVITNAS